MLVTEILTFFKIFYQVLKISTKEFWHCWFKQLDRLYIMIFQKKEANTTRDSYANGTQKYYRNGPWIYTETSIQHNQRGNSYGNIQNFVKIINYQLGILKLQELTIRKSVLFRRFLKKNEIHSFFSNFIPNNWHSVLYLNIR